MLQILHIKLAENVAAPTSKMETAEKWESDDVLQSILEQLSPAVSAAAMVDGMVGSREMDFWLEVRESRIFNYTRLLNCSWLMWRIGHGNSIIPTFTVFALVTESDRIYTPLRDRICKLRHKNVAAIGNFFMLFPMTHLGAKKEREKKEESSCLMKFTQYYCKRMQE